jgi:hypothetical protein
LHELHEHCIHKPSMVKVVPVTGFSSQQWNNFANPNPLNLLPEVGSRGMLRLRVEGELFYTDWINAQTNIYSYYVSQSSGIEVRILLLNYFACHVTWE